MLGPAGGMERDGRAQEAAFTEQTIAPSCPLLCPQQKYRAWATMRSPQRGSESVAQKNAYENLLSCHLLFPETATHCLCHSGPFMQKMLCAVRFKVSLIPFILSLDTSSLFPIPPPKDRKKRKKSLLNNTLYIWPLQMNKMPRKINGHRCECKGSCGSAPIVLETQEKE